MPFLSKHLPCVRAKEHCSRCNRTFSDKEGLIQHLQHNSKHFVPDVPEGCIHCGRPFSSTGALIQHLKTNRHHLRDLHHAACTGRFQLLGSLMRNEFANEPGDSHRPCSKSQMGFTPMHCAAFSGHYECLKIMLSWPDGKPNVIDPKDGRTPVHLAAWKGHANCLKLLLKNGGDLHRPDQNGGTPLSLASDHPSCLSMIFFHLAGQRNLPRARAGFYSVYSQERYVEALEYVLNRLHRQDSFEQHFTRRVEEVIEDSERSRTENQVQPFQLNSEIEEPSSKPYEVLARGKETVEIFNQALHKGKAKVTRLQLTVIGDIGAGKTSLVRSLSGENFVEERIETHGIDTSMVEVTELDDSWHVTDLNSKSFVDEILTDRVCECFKEAKGSSSAYRSSFLDPGPSLRHPPSTRRLLSIDRASEGHASSDDANDQTSLVPFTRSRSEQTPPRDIPVDLITRKLSNASLDLKERKYIKLSIWDFAGHPLYQAMHHVFLNRRSFYLVVTNLVQLCDPKSTDLALQQLHFWLNSVRVHTPQTTPVFLVGTHSKAVSQEALSNAEKQLYDEFSATFAQQLVKNQEKNFLFSVENTLGSVDEGALLLKKTIKEEASRLNLMDEEFPVLWLHFEEEILKCRERTDCSACVTKGFLKTMLVESNFDVSDETFESMLRFYHDSGVIILPGELIGPETQNTEMNNLVVINPQYLVDVMTCLHDIPDHLDVDREHRPHWQKLQDQGITDMELLNNVWKKFKSPASDLVAILEACGMLCPISSSVRVEDPESHSEKDEGRDRDRETETRTFIVPFHLEVKSLKKKWERLCRRTWQAICNTDKVLMFDFLSFLPPALFEYFIVRTAAKSKSSSGMTPIIAKEMAIFSFGDSFFFLAETCPKFNQIKISARYKNGKKLHELFSTLMTIMSEICQHQFRFLKFGFGPICPNKRCPGTSCDGRVLKTDSSSDESDGELDGNSTCDEADDSLISGETRPHVISIDPTVSSKPLWCNSTPVHEFEEIKEWLVKSQDTECKVPEDSPCYSKRVGQCCQVAVAQVIGNRWKWLGRCLGIDETVIENIQSENESEEERAFQVLRRWLREKGSKATVHLLMKAIGERSNVEAMEAFAHHLGEFHSKETIQDD